MKLFGFKKFNEKKEKSNLISSIESLQSSLTGMHLYRVIVKLDKIIDKLDDEETTLNSRKLESINRMLSSMRGHLDQNYEALLLSKCEHIMKCITSDASFESNNNSSRNNYFVKQETRKSEDEDKDYELLAELDDIDKQIAALNEKIACTKSANQIKLLKFRLQRLVNLKAIKSKNYNSYLTGVTNKEFARDILEGQQVAEEIAADNEEVDIEEIKDQAETIKEVSDDVTAKDTSIQDVVVNVLGPEVDNYQMEQEEAEKILEANIAENKKKHKQNQAQSGK